MLDSIRDILAGGGPTAGTVGRQVTQALEVWARESRRRFDELVAERLSGEDPHRYARGTWSASYILGEPDQPPDRGPFLEIMRQSPSYTGWRVWFAPQCEATRPYPFNGLLECWIIQDGVGECGAVSDFWRVDPRGRFFLIRGLKEDCHAPQISPGTTFDLYQPIWLVGETLLHAKYTAEALGVLDQQAGITFCWEGLEGRALRDHEGKRNWRGLDFRKSRQPRVVTEGEFRPDTIDAKLPGLVRQLTPDLYEAFDLTRIPEAVVQEELRRMRRE